MRPESAKLLSDILEAAHRIADYTCETSLAAFLADNELRDAEHWNFAVMGEALSHLSKLDPDTVDASPSGVGS